MKGKDCLLTARLLVRFCPPEEYHRREHTNRQHHTNDRSHLPIHLQNMTPTLSRPARIIFEARLVVVIKMLQLDYMMNRSIKGSRICKEPCDTHTYKHLTLSYQKNVGTLFRMAQTLGKRAAKFDPIKAHKCKDCAALHDNPFVSILIEMYFLAQ